MLTDRCPPAGHGALVFFYLLPEAAADFWPLSLATSCFVVLPRVGRRRSLPVSLASQGLFYDVALTLASSRRVWDSGERRCRAALDCNLFSAGGGLSVTWCIYDGSLGRAGCVLRLYLQSRHC